jgi:hypothetical protein
MRELLLPPWTSVDFSNSQLEALLTDILGKVLKNECNITLALSLVADLRSLPGYVAPRCFAIARQRRREHMAKVDRFDQLTVAVHPIPVFYQTCDWIGSIMHASKPCYMLPLIFPKPLKGS